MSMRVHPFYFFRRRRRGRNGRFASVDSLTVTTLLAALQPRGYEIGDLYLNYPQREDRPNDRVDVDLSRFTPGDLILSATRFELARSLHCRKRVQMADTPIEKMAEQAWSRVVRRSERLQVVLQPETAAWFEPGFANRANVEFNEREGASYTAFPTTPRVEARRLRATVVYLLRAHELWPGGPAYLGFFGLDSTAALAGASVIRARHADLLLEEGFSMLEIAGPVPGRVGDTRWAGGWESRVILREPSRDSARTPAPRTAA